MAELRQRLAQGLGAALGLAGAVLVLVLWLGSSPAVLPQEPGADRPGYSQGGASGAARTVAIGRDFRPGKALAAPAGSPGAAWPGFRGPGRDNRLPGGPRLSDLADYSARRLLWRVSLGEGHGGAAVAEGRVYVLDYDESNRSEALRCLSLADGGELWRRSYPLRMKRNHGYSRTVPQVWGKWVVSVGPLGQVMCCDRLSGDLAWSLDPGQKWQAAVPLWYAGQCPYVDNGVLVLAVGGAVLMAGIDLASGAVLWTSPNPEGAKTTHASVMPMTVGSTPLYLACFSTGFYAVSGGGTPGRVLFRLPGWTVQVEVPSPLALPDNLVYLTAGYGAGNLMLRLSEDGPGVISGRQVFRNQPGTALSCEQQTPIALAGRIFGIQTKDAGSMHDQLVCMNADGSIAWTSSKGRRFGLGPYLEADGKLYVLSDDGWMTVVEADAQAYRELSRQRIFEATDAWGPMALAGDRLLLRDAKNLLCLDLGVHP
jgi:outer membrane protein assembly factor BamB